MFALQIVLIIMKLMKHICEFTNFFVADANFLRGGCSSCLLFLLDFYCIELQLLDVKRKLFIKCRFLCSISCVSQRYPFIRGKTKIYDKHNRGIQARLDFPYL